MIRILVRVRRRVGKHEVSGRCLQNIEREARLSSPRSPLLRHGRCTIPTVAGKGRAGEGSVPLLMGPRTGGEDEIACRDVAISCPHVSMPNSPLFNSTEPPQPPGRAEPNDPVSPPPAGPPFPCARSLGGGPLTDARRRSARKRTGRAQAVTAPP
jgi:hypothetical protein